MPLVYFIALSLEDIHAINSRGLESNIVTHHWGSVIKHPTLDEWAVGIHESDVACFSDKQLPSVLEPHSAGEMTANGWDLNATPAANPA